MNVYDEKIRKALLRYLQQCISQDSSFKVNTKPVGKIAKTVWKSAFLLIQHSKYILSYIVPYCQKYTLHTAFFDDFAHWEAITKTLKRHWLDV